MLSACAARVCRRWDGDFLTASALIKCGVLGRLVECESHLDRYRPALKMGWKEDADLPGAGVLFDLGGCSLAGLLPHGPRSLQGRCTVCFLTGTCVSAGSRLPSPPC
jgi:hypothetical protein